MIYAYCPEWRPHTAPNTDMLPSVGTTEITDPRMPELPYCQFRVEGEAATHSPWTGARRYSGIDRNDSPTLTCLTHGTEAELFRQFPAWANRIIAQIQTVYRQDGNFWHRRHLGVLPDLHASYRRLVDAS